MIPIDMMFIIKWYVNRHHAPCTSHLCRSWSPSERCGQRGQQSGGAVRNDPLMDWQLSGMTLDPSGPWNRWPFWVNHPSFSSHQLMIELGCIASVIWVVKPNFQSETVVIFVPAYSLHVWCFFFKTAIHTRGLLASPDLRDVHSENSSVLLYKGKFCRTILKRSNYDLGD